MALPLGVLLRRALSVMTASLAILLRGLCAYKRSSYTQHISKTYFGYMIKVASTTLPDCHRIYSWRV